MDYNSKEELIGEFIDLMDTFELDVNKIKDKEMAKELCREYGKQLNNLFTNTFSFILEESHNVE